LALIASLQDRAAHVVGVEEGKEILALPDREPSDPFHDGGREATCRARGERGCHSSTRRSGECRCRAIAAASVADPERSRNPGEPAADLKISRAPAAAVDERGAMVSARS